MQISTLKINQTKSKTRDEKINKTLKGVLINNHIVNPNENNVSFDDMQDSLLVVNAPKYYKIPVNNKNENEESPFNIKKAIKPLIAGTLVIAGGILGLSSILKHSSKTLLSSKSFEQLPDLAVNMNIKEEPQFAIYRAIRDPNFKNVLGAAAIFIMSGITIACKNFVDGAKEIWLKKQSADIEKELQEKLIEVETNSFSGKLNIINEMLQNNIKYFDSVLNNKPVFKSTNILNKYVTFKGSNEETKKDDKKNLKYLLAASGVVLAALIAGKLSLSNLRKTAKYSSDYADKFTESTINAINETVKKADKKDIPSIVEMLKSICAKPEFIKEIGEKYKLTPEEIDSVIRSVEQTKKTIFADAPTALGGIPKKIQYYCYIDENRGHLYNWVLNPENKFTKYIFIAFTLSSAIGYLFKQTMDALKDVTVLKENAKTELNLRKRLVEVEINNFKAKKESAIQPLVDNFTLQFESGIKTREELKALADNILLETKNGPPYVYT